MANDLCSTPSRPNLILRVIRNVLITAAQTTGPLLYHLSCILNLGPQISDHGTGREVLAHGRSFLRAHLSLRLASLCEHTASLFLLLFICAASPTSLHIPQNVALSSPSHTLIPSGDNRISTASAFPKAASCREWLWASQTRRGEARRTSTWCHLEHAKKSKPCMTTAAKRKERSETARKPRTRRR